MTDVRSGEKVFQTQNKQTASEKKNTQQTWCNVTAYQQP